MVFIELCIINLTFAGVNKQGDKGYPGETLVSKSPLTMSLIKDLKNKKQKIKQNNKKRAAVG